MAFIVLPTLIEAPAISVEAFQTRRPLERNYATRARRMGPPYALELSALALLSLRTCVKAQETEDPSPPFLFQFHLVDNCTRRQWPGLQTRRIVLEFRVTTRPLNRRRPTDSDRCHVALQMFFARRQTLVSFDSPLFHARMLLLVARQTIVGFGADSMQYVEHSPYFFINLTLSERMPPYSRHHKYSKKIECRHRGGKNKNNSRLSLELFR